MAHATRNLCFSSSSINIYKGPKRLNSRPDSDSTINYYACSKEFPVTGPTVDEGIYVNTRDEPVRYSTKIPSAIYEDVDGQDLKVKSVDTTCATHILVNCPKCKLSDNDEEKSNTRNNTIRADNLSSFKDLCSKQDTTRKKSTDNGNDNDSYKSIVLQEGETLLVENSLYNSNA